MATNVMLPQWGMYMEDGTLLKWLVKEGDEVTVKVIGFDRGKVKLSIKQAVA